MTRTIAPVAALLLSVAILLTGNGLQSTLLPLRAKIEAFSTLDIGVLGSAYFLGFAGGCVFGPYMVRRVGHIRAFTALVSIASTTALAHALVLSPLAWWPLRAITGFCFAALYMIIESWLNERATNENRGVIFSVYTIINLTVLTVGQMMITLYSLNEFALFALASVLVSLAAVPVAMTKAEAPGPVATVRIRVRHLYGISPVGFVGGIVVGSVNGAFWSLGPVFADLKGMGTTGVAVFMSVIVIAGAFGQWPFGRLSDRWDRRKVIIIACTGAGAAAVALSGLGRTWPEGMFLLAVLYGVFALPIYGLCAAHMNDFVEEGGFVEAASGLLLLYAAGAVVGPMVASALMRGFGPYGLFTFTAAMHAVLACFSVYRMTRRARRPEEVRARFMDSLRVAQTVAAMDPLAATPKPAEAAPAARAGRHGAAPTPSDPLETVEQPGPEPAEEQPHLSDHREAVSAVGTGDPADVDAEQAGHESERQEDPGDRR